MFLMHLVKLGNTNYKCPVLTKISDVFIKQKAAVLVHITYQCIRPFGSVCLFSGFPVSFLVTEKNTLTAVLN